MRNKYLNKITDAEDYFNELKRYDRAVYVVKNSGWEMTDDYKGLLKQFDKICSNSSSIKGKRGGSLFLDSTQKDSKLKWQSLKDMTSETTFEDTTFLTRFSKDAGVYINDEKQYALQGSGIILVVYDPSTHQCIDIVQFLKKDSFSLSRPK